jgi:hypothetical protein
MTEELRSIVLNTDFLIRDDYEMTRSVRLLKGAWQIGSKRSYLTDGGQSKRLIPSLATGSITLFGANGIHSHIRV